MCKSFPSCDSNYIYKFIYPKSNILDASYDNEKKKY